MRLGDLAPELIFRILDHVDPPAIVDVACSSKFLEACSRDLLRKHQKDNARYQVVTDMLPQSLPDVLRKASVDPGLAWHVRELEITCARRKWSQWKTSETEGTEDSHTVRSLDYAFTQNEQIGFLDQFRQVFHFDEQEIDKARDDLEAGNDAPIKLLLLGVCPRVRSIKFTKHIKLPKRDDDGHDPFTDLRAKRRSSLHYFHQAILNQLRNNASAWPMGLSSLQELAMGVDSGDSTRDLEFNPTPLLCANMMQLPHLVSLYCFGLEFEDNGEEEHRVAMQVNYKGSSSVQQIFLESSSGLAWNWEVLIAECKQLKSLTLAGGDLNDIDAWIQTAGKYHGKSLETLMFYDRQNLSGYRCVMFRPEELQGLSSLRMVFNDAEDMIDEISFEWNDGIKRGPGEDKWPGTELDHFVEHFMWMFPKSMEVLVLAVGYSFAESDAELLDQALATMIEFGRNDDRNNAEDKVDVEPEVAANPFRGYQPNLKAVYLHTLDQRHSSASRPPPRPRQQRLFQKAITAGRKFNVDVHTRTTRSRPFHQIEFPKPPTLVSPERATTHADDTVVFDIYKGKWSAPGCGNCGECTDCLQQYDVSVWEEVQGELEAERS